MMKGDDIMGTTLEPSNGLGAIDISATVLEPGLAISGPTSPVRIDSPRVESVQADDMTATGVMVIDAVIKALDSRYSDFNSMRLHDSRIEDSTFWHDGFAGCEMKDNQWVSEVDFSECVFERSRIENNRMDRVSFDSSDFTDATITGNVFDGCSFDGMALDATAAISGNRFIDCDFGTCPDKSYQGFIIGLMSANEFINCRFDDGRRALDSIHSHDDGGYDAVLSTMGDETTPVMTVSMDGTGSGTPEPRPLPSMEDTWFDMESLHG